MPVTQAVIAILFYKAEPVTFEELAKVSGAQLQEVMESLEQARVQLETLGLTVITTDTSAELRTNKDTSSLIDSIRKEELSRDLGKAALETLSILMYRGPSTRAEIDYVRGVNSTAIVRNLLIRGLVEKVANPQDQRSFIYKPTHELFAYLGISKIEDMTEYAAIKAELDTFHAHPETTDHQ